MKTIQPATGSFKTSIGRLFFEQINSKHLRVFLKEGYPLEYQGNKIASFEATICPLSDIPLATSDLKVTYAFTDKGTVAVCHPKHKASIHALINKEFIQHIKTVDPVMLIRFKQFAKVTKSATNMEKTLAYIKQVRELLVELENSLANL